MALMMISRSLVAVMISASTPEMNTKASACCHVYLYPSTSVKAKKALSPMPGASAIG